MTITPLSVFALGMITGYDYDVWSDDSGANLPSVTTETGATVNISSEISPKLLQSFTCFNVAGWHS